MRRHCWAERFIFLEEEAVWAERVLETGAGGRQRSTEIRGEIRGGRQSDGERRERAERGAEKRADEKRGSV